jgi:hypothetical protein
MKVIIANASKTLSNVISVETGGLLYILTHIDEFFIENKIKPSEIVCRSYKDEDSLGESYAILNDLRLIYFPILWTDFTENDCKIVEEIDKKRVFNKFTKQYDTVNVKREYNKLAGVNRDKIITNYADILICFHDEEKIGKSINFLIHFFKSTKKLHWIYPITNRFFKDLDNFSNTILAKKCKLKK